MSTGESTRACFLLKVKPGLLDEYRQRHSPVWAEMLLAIRDAGWSNYTIFAHEDGTIVGYFETDDLARARAEMESVEVGRRWDAATTHLFAESQQWLTPIFSLDEQLRAAGQ
jgi:L-rhamnose mutarotase